MIKINIIISNASRQPIYEQIYTQIKADIINDSLKEGEMLPSIRNLAKDLKVSVITTKRAYDELENGGYIYSVAGKGSYVAPKNVELLREASLIEIQEHMQKISNLASHCKLSTDDIIEMYRIICEEENI